jgi:outer membrane protein assembly factor BamB
MMAMRKVILNLVLISVCAALALSQSRGGNWPTLGGDAQGSGWEGADARISKEKVKDLQLLFKLKLESQSKGLRPLMPPIILGRLISYRGFRELAFVGSNSDIVYAIDADLGTIFWQKHLEYSTREPQATSSTPDCPGGMTAMPTMPVPGINGPRGAAAPQRGGAPAQAGSFIAGTASVYAISSDGRLHRLNTSTGDDMVQPVQVIPANSKISSLRMVNGVIYAVTSPACNLTQNAVWAIDLTGDVPKASSYALNDGELGGSPGTVIGSDGTIYVQTSRRLLAFSAGTLALSGYFNLEDAGADDRRDVPAPLAFQFKDRQLVAAAGKDGRIYLLDAASFGGNHSTPLDRTMPLAVSAGLSTWQDTDNTRWILAPVWGRNGAAPSGSISAFKVEEQSGKVVLTPAWVSRDMASPLTPVVASSVVFAVSAGEFTRERAKNGTRATLFALDATTGKELYSSRNLVGAPASLAGITVSNGRVYFSTLDGTFYAFGIYLEH